MHWSSARPRTLSHVLFPERTWITRALLILAGSAFVALAAQIRVDLPFTPVPITGQTLAVLLVGGLLGSRLGAAALLTYLAQGAAGLPVFAGGTGGLAVLTGPSGGYLVGFVAAAFVTGWLIERGVDRTPWVMAAMLAGNAVVYAVGLPWLAYFVGADVVLTAGLWPFVPGDLVKLIIAALTLPSGWALVERIPGFQGLRQ